MSKSHFCLLPTFEETLWNKSVGHQVLIRSLRFLCFTLATLPSTNVKVASAEKDTSATYMLKAEN